MASKGLSGPPRGPWSGSPRPSRDGWTRCSPSSTAPLVEAAEATALLDRVSADLDMDPRDLEKIEERLFALRALARKHGVEVDALPELRDRLSAQLAAIDDGGASLKKLAEAEAAARKAFGDAALNLSGKRQAAAAKLDKAVTAELDPLRLGKARFTTTGREAGRRGLERDRLRRRRLRGRHQSGLGAWGRLNRISSGGEMSRFMLALKVVLARADAVPTLVFDEVDANVGGAVAAAVGERLATLAGNFQVMVITHSPQVAALGGNHLRVAKSEDGGSTVTRVEILSAQERKEEIARMLAGGNHHRRGAGGRGQPAGGWERPMNADVRSLPVEQLTELDAATELKAPGPRDRRP